VHYESYGKGSDAVISIHGWTCDHTFWRGQAPIYETHRALLVDLPGRGQSEKPDVAYTHERFARATNAVMRDAGVDHAVLVGHSMGGPVALTFLALARVMELHPQPVAQALRSAVDWLRVNTADGTAFPPTPIGFYFHSLWYFEDRRYTC
jgi:pimeloyl-ACP methyl ester carboxylesterase